MELVSIKVFNTEVEAEMVRLFLESHQVECFVFGNVLANTYNVFNSTSGGVHLKVAQSNLEVATQLLENFYDSKSEDQN